MNRKLVALIPAAGVGSRLRPLTDDRPKTLIEVQGKPILLHIVEPLLTSPVSEIVIVTGYREDEIKRFIRNQDLSIPVRFVTNPIYDITNNIYSLFLGLQAIDSDMLLIDGDLVYSKKALDAVLESGGPISFACHTKDLSEVRFTVDSDGFVLSIGKHVPLEEAFGDSIGLHLFSKDAMNALYRIIEKMVSEGLVGVFYEAAFERMIREEKWRFRPVDVTGMGCLEIDTVEDLEKAKVILGKDSWR